MVIGIGLTVSLNLTFNILLQPTNPTRRRMTMFKKLLASKILPALRVFVYRRGLRPKRGSLLFSPSLDVIYGLKQYVKHIKRN